MTFYAVLLGLAGYKMILSKMNNAKFLFAFYLLV